MDIKSFEVGPFAENTYLLTQGGESILIDPGFSNKKEFSRFRAELGNQNSRLIGVLLTHAHIDHVLGLPFVLSAFDTDVYLSHKDLHPWNHISEQAAMFRLKADELSFTPEKLEEQKAFTLGSFTMDLLYTPGHAPDHLSIYFEDENLLIAGDTLFKGSVGRADLYKGDMDLLTKSIRDKIYTLPDETVVYPGHGPSTTVGQEKKNNPFVKG
ncbi:MBL fold metallo-hydrolase [Rhodohalobacter sp. SW132]|nr:MBL fold metallo-hydrolase [Rhodohalobacter sp. SW132]